MRIYFGHTAHTLRSACCALFAGILALAGCTFVVRPNPVPLIAVPEKVNVDVGLVVSDAQRLQTHTKSGLCLVGIVHTWRIETGAAMGIGAERAFRAIFTSVELVKSKDEAVDKALTLTVTPTISYFGIEQSLSAQLHLHCMLTDREGTVLYENTVPGTGSSGSAAGGMFGVFGGEASLSENSAEAFNRAFVFLAADIMRKVDFAPYTKE